MLGHGCSESGIHTFTQLFRRRNPQVAHLAGMQFEHPGNPGFI
jgi:hypothetical protein